MIRHIIKSIPLALVLSMSGIVVAQTNLPRIALIETINVNASPTQVSEASMAIRFAIEETGLFRNLTAEEIHAAYMAQGETAPPTCLTLSCQQDIAQTLDAQVLAGFTLRYIQGQPHLEFFLRSASSGDIISSIQVSARPNHPVNLVSLARVAVGRTLGVSLEDSTLGIQQDPPAPSSAPARWVTGSMATSIGLVAAAWLQGRFMTQDNNTLDSGFTENHDGSYLLSGVPGFFFGTRAPDARTRALGGAGVALDARNGFNGLNPAGLVNLEHQEARVSTAALPSGAGQQLLARWSAPYRPGIAWSQSARYEGDGLASELAAQSALGVDFSLLSPWLVGLEGGLQIKGLSLQVGEEGTGRARSTGFGLGTSIDVGLQWQLWNGPRAGVLVENAWSYVYYKNTLTNRSYREDLPATLAFGTSWEAPTHTLIALDLRKAILPGQRDHLLVGLEQNLFGFADLRGGLRKPLGTEVYLWSLGAGIVAHHEDLVFHLDIAYETSPEPYAALASHQILSMALEF